MSLLVFPEFPGVDIEISETIEYQTKVFETTGAAVRHAARQVSKRTFKLPLSVLIDDVYANKTELKELQAFFMKMKGRYRGFWYLHPLDNSIANEVLPLKTNGVDTEFQLIRSFFDGQSQTTMQDRMTEPTQNIKSVDSVYLLDESGYSSAVLVNDTDYSVNDMTGIITFNTAPPADHYINWSGSYYYRCFFDDDKLTFNRVVAGAYNCKDLSFSGSVANVV